MQDLVARLGEDHDPAASSLVGRLSRFVDGSLAGLFGGPTNVALDRSLTVFNVQALEAELRAVAIHLITTFIWGQVRRVRKPRLLIVDEAWTLLQHPEGGAFLATLARRARKYHLGLICISQDVADFLASEHGRTVLANAAIKLLLKQDGSSIEPVVAALRLSHAERQFLLGAEKGDALLFARGARVPLKVEASRFEYRLATTAPGDAWHDADASEKTTSRPGGEDVTGAQPMAQRGTDHVRTI
jgi:DNA helicase HerA-like ATPase